MALGWTGRASSRPGWSQVLEGARWLIGYASLTLLVAFALGCVLGALAASGPSVFDALLARLLEVAGALPTVLWAAALYQILGAGLLFALALGALRALDVAWLLRTDLLRRARIDAELGGRSLGRFPLSAYLRQRLQPALSPARSALALTPAWALTLGATGFLCGFPAVAGPPGWHALLSGAFDGQSLPSLSAALLSSALTGLLLLFLTAPPRRVGAFRSVPPPAGGATEQLSLHHVPKSES
jgi:ABC-type dipeptide/oligopeptide/nickel transport system permease subunit